MRKPYLKNLRFVNADVLKTLGLEDLPLPEAPVVQHAPKSKRKLVVSEGAIEPSEKPAPPITNFFEKPVVPSQDEIDRAWFALAPYGMPSVSSLLRVKYIDDDTKVPYYHNSITEQSVWEKPATFVAPAQSK